MRWPGGRAMGDDGTAFVPDSQIHCLIGASSTPREHAPANRHRPRCGDRPTVHTYVAYACCMGQESFRPCRRRKFGIRLHRRHEPVRASPRSGAGSVAAAVSFVGSRRCPQSRVRTREHFRDTGGVMAQVEGGAHVDGALTPTRMTASATWPNSAPSACPCTTTTSSPTTPRRRTATRS